MVATEGPFGNRSGSTVDASASYQSHAPPRRASSCAEERSSCPTPYRDHVEVALTLALSYVLSFARIWQLPQGGEVSLAMLPLFVLALRRGLQWDSRQDSCTASSMSSTCRSSSTGCSFSWTYPLAYAAVGLAGIFAPLMKRAIARRRWGVAVFGAVVPGIALGALGRFGFHLVSGAVFFAQYAEGQPVWAYSAAYNSFVFVSAVLCGLCAPLVLISLARVVPTGE